MGNSQTKQLGPESVLKKDEIELQKTASGRWEFIQDRFHKRTIDDIPSIGTPVEFFAMLFCIWLVSCLF